MTPFSYVPGCKKLTYTENGSLRCSIHDGYRPSICTEFSCATSKIELSRGNPDPCNGCTPIKMSDEGCCVGTNVGFGMKNIPVRSFRKESQTNQLLTSLADRLLDGTSTPEEIRRELKARNLY